MSGIFDPLSGKLTGVSSLPFGQTNLNGSGDNFPFTDHERDAENGTDATLFRHYSPAQGRWLTPDPYNGSLDLSDPQSFNRYAYLANRPMASVDQNGLCSEDDDYSGCDDGGDSWGSSGWGGFGNSGVDFGTSYDDSGGAHAYAYLMYGSSDSGLSAQGSSDTFSSYISQTLDIVGLVPELGAFANGANAAIQYSQGNNGQAALYAAGAAASLVGVPGGSALAKAGKAFALLQDAREAEQAGSLISSVRNIISAQGSFGEMELKGLGGVSQQSFSTGRGRRVIDQLVDGHAHESKVGYTNLSSTVQGQISKDALLIEKEVINSSTWHFFRSPVTGKVGASRPLLDALDKAGIKTIIH